MANNIEAYCPRCREVTLHMAYTEGWMCDDCDNYNDNIGENPYHEDYL